MGHHRWLIFPLALIVMLGLADLSSAQKMKRPLEGPLITVHVPQPKRLELALDEVELHCCRTGSANAQAPTFRTGGIVGVQITEMEQARFVVRLSGVTSSADLLAKATALVAVNPGAETHLVVYQPGLPKTKSTRHLLTREVALLLEPGQDPAALMTGVAVGELRPVPGVRGGFVVEAGDPLAAVDLADTLRQRPGVRSAYPLLKMFAVPQ